MLQEAVELVSRIESNTVPWLPYGLVVGCQFRVLQVDEENNIIILNFRMPPHTTTQSHDHHCMAMAYTLSGEWMYGDQVFRQGDIAFERPGEIHQPTTAESGAELLTILIGGKGNDKTLQNFEDDGTSYIFPTRFFKAIERVSPEELARLDLKALLDFQ